MTQDYMPPGDDDQPYFDDNVTPIRREPKRGTGITMYDHAVERALVATVFIKPDCYTQATNAGVTPSTFTDATLGFIWQTLDRLNNDGQPLDPVTVAARGKAERLPVPDAAKLFQLGEGEGFKTSNAPAYAQQLVEYQTTRYFYEQVLALSNGKFVNLRPELDRIAAEWDQARNTGTAGAQWEDVARALSGEMIGKPPTVLGRADGVCALFYFGKINSVFGPSESCKSWLAQAACVEQLALGEHVVYFDFEKDLPSVLERLVAMGASEEALLERFHYQRREDKFTAAEMAVLRAEVVEMGPGVVVFDGVTEAMRLEGKDILDNTGIAGWYNGVPHLFEAADWCAIAVDHDKKDPESVTQGSIGGQHKRAGITGASYKMRLTQVPARGKSGRGYLKVDKDAPGHVRGHAPDGVSIGDVVITVDGGRIVLTVEAPALAPITKSAEGVPRRTGYMERVSKVLEDEGHRGGSSASIAKTLGASSNYVNDALKCLTAEGFTNWNGKSANGSKYFHVRPFREVRGGSFSEPEDD